MMIKQRSFLVGIMLGAMASGAIGVSAVAWAGAKDTSRSGFHVYPDGSGYGSGSLGAAWNSANSVERIGCHVDAVPDLDGELVVSGFCEVTDQTGASAMCVTRDERLIQLMLSVGPSTRVGFRWDPEGWCTSVGVSHESHYLPP
ncbi:hypothetical protein [Sorangium sp. So ce131]|uniref:hypothetical protein n=1 Tax=Sorangium sp. So ce131 TaxID=3133282 RepID=UPI003F5FA053